MFEGWMCISSTTGAGKLSVKLYRSFNSFTIHPEFSTKVCNHFPLSLRFHDNDLSGLVHILLNTARHVFKGSPITETIYQDNS